MKSRTTKSARSVRSTSARKAPVAAASSRRPIAGRPASMTAKKRGFAALTASKRKAVSAKGARARKAA